MEVAHMPRSALYSPLLGGRLAVDFVNTGLSQTNLLWEELIVFFQGARVVTAERGAHLLTLPDSDLAAAEMLLRRSQRLRDALRKISLALIHGERFEREWTVPINEVLRITEGHDELVMQDGSWRIEFMAREGGLDWLLAAIARSGAEIIVEGASARLRQCANGSCGLIFCDTSRTRRRRWCSMSTCGNRHKVAAFARKHAAHRRPA
jgi:predicted RNA-binding Zn ribbon-like protein